MIITEAYINSIAPNADAFKKGLLLAKGKSFINLSISQDESLIFGECLGSSKTPYFISADLTDNNNPVFRCTCPSRQFPCKHALGLLLAYTMKQNFKIAEIPEDVIKKREKAQQKKEKKEIDIQEASKSKKPNLSAEKKKITAQLEGLSILNKVVNEIVRDGLGQIDKRKIDFISSQAKELGNYYLSGAQNLINELIVVLSEDKSKEAYDESIYILSKINVYIKKETEYLNNRLKDENLRRNTDTDLETQLGYAWQLTELYEAGLYEDNALLIQLKFTSYNDMARKEITDQATYINLSDGKLYKTFNYRPYKALKYIKEEDSCSHAIKPERLFIYPGGLNRRIRWDKSEFNEITIEHIEQIKQKARDNFAEIIKELKNNFKNLLAENSVQMLVKYKSIVQIKDNFAIEDFNGELITISGNGTITLKLLEKATQGGYMLLCFKITDNYSKISAEPLSLIYDNKIIELSF